MTCLRCHSDIHETVDCPTLNEGVDMKGKVMVSLGSSEYPETILAVEVGPALIAGFVRVRTLNGGLLTVHEKQIQR